MKQKRNHNGEGFFRVMAMCLLLLGIISVLRWGVHKEIKKEEVLPIGQDRKSHPQKKIHPRNIDPVMGIIPLPAQYELTAQSFLIDQPIDIYINTEEVRITALLLQRELQGILPYPIRIVRVRDKVSASVMEFLRLSPNKSSAASVRIYLWQDNKNLSENYELKTFTSSRTIHIKGGKKGVFYGMISLLQLLYQRYEGKVHIPQLLIKDAPNFPYRGLHLDVARHFFSVYEVKKLIKWMAFFKLNKLHLHLSDDQGWRVEIKSFPQLTRIGARREETLVGRDKGAAHGYVFDKTPHEGYYTQQEIKELLYYARIHQVEIIPEIDMPSHVLAMIAAYPFLACDEHIKYNVQGYWRGSDIPLCLGKESTYEWLFKLLSELTALFPSPYFHIGHDETRESVWLSCAHCKDRMQKLGIDNTEDYKYYFLQRIATYLRRWGKRPVIWDDAFQSVTRLAHIPSTVLMVWKQKRHIAQALNQGMPTIIAMHQPFYLNYYQAKPHHREPLAFSKTNTLADVYQYALPNRILGAEALLWTEYVRTMKDVEYQLFPRLIAAAENFWTLPQYKAYPSFLKRLRASLPYLAFQKIRYAPHFK